MSETANGEIRRAIGAYAHEHETAMQEDLVTEVAESYGVAAETVEDELDRLEEGGFIYLVNGEVKVA